VAIPANAFLDRPIEGDRPYLWIDATYLKVRQNGRIVSVAAIIAVGVNNDGRREMLGMDIGPSEAETTGAVHTGQIVLQNSQHAVRPISRK
jgi:transposase-like protein